MKWGIFCLAIAMLILFGLVVKIVLHDYRNILTPIAIVLISGIWGVKSIIKHRQEHPSKITK